MRSLSNMIKSYTVRYEEQTKKTIDTHLRINQEIIVKQIPNHEAMNGSLGFVEGIKAIPVEIEKLPSEEEMKEMSDRLIMDAKNEARHILDKAKQEAEQIKNDAYQLAQQKGYDDGMQQSIRESQKLKLEFEENTRKLQAQYNAMVSELEPQIVEIMAALLEKITGILVEDKEEVLLCLIDRALSNRSKCKEYNIRVSKEDYDYIISKKSNLQNCIGDVTLNISEDPELGKNQCLIETEQYVIDCSLDVQLNNLISDLKLLGGV